MDRRVRRSKLSSEVNAPLGVRDRCSRRPCSVYQLCHNRLLRTGPHADCSRVLQADMTVWFGAAGRSVKAARR
jgi:hypothetical protein